MNQTHLPVLDQHTRTLRRFFLLVAFLLPCFALAQSSDTGSVQGRVLNEASGQYVGNARVSVAGTDRVAFTDPTGRFNLTLVPAGSADLLVTTPSGLSTQQSVTVRAGEISRAEITFGARGALGDDDVLELEALTVESEADAYATAIAEMRQAKNNKTVVDSGVFGDVAEGNVGEYIKYLPGISVNYTAADVRSIEVRGLGANFTPVTVDGNRMASAASSGGSRTFELEQVSINNVERIEVTKVPTADMSADSLGGAVNLVSKSAFERTGREIRYKAYLNANSEDLTLGEVAWADEKRRVVLPGVDFSYADVFADGDVGIMVTYLTSNQFNEQHRSRPRWDFEEYSDGLADARPILRRYQFQDGPKFTFRDSYGVRADFRLSPTTSVSSGMQYNTYLSQFRNNNVTWDTNMNERSDARDENVVDFDRVQSRIGGGDIDIGGSWRDKSGQTFHADIALKHFGTNLEFEVGGFFSRATNNYDDISEGFLEGVFFDYDVPGQIELTDAGGLKGDYKEEVAIIVTDLSGNVDPNLGVTDFTGFELLEVIEREVSSVDKFMGANADLTYHLEIADRSVSVSTGARFQSQNRDNFAPRDRFLYDGPHDIYDPNDFILTNYLGEETGYDSIPPIPFANHAAVTEFYLANRDLFIEGSRADDNVNARAAGDFEITEDITAVYLMADSKFLEDRLSVNVGVRYEHTGIEGTALAVDNSDSSAPVITGTTRQEQSYDGLFPSANLKFDILPDLVLRLGYAQSIGRPEFTDILPLTQISDPEPGDDPDDNPLGSVQVNNTGLKPYEADTFDLTLEYYLGRGGSFTASIFQKNVDGIIVDWNIDRGTVNPDTGAISGGITQAEIDYFNLPSSVLGYRLQSSRNLEDGKVKGAEIGFIYAFKHTESLPEWARGFTVFANGTWQEADGAIPNLLDKVINFGATWQNKKFKAQVKYNIRGRKLQSTSSAGDLNYTLYFEEFPTLDVNFEYRVHKHAKLFFNARNLLEEPQKRILVADNSEFTLLDRSERFGIQLTLGVKGSF